MNQTIADYIRMHVRCIWAQPDPDPKAASVDSIFISAKYDMKTKQKDYQDALKEITIDGNIRINGFILEPRQKMFVDLFYLTKKEVQKYIEKQKHLTKNHNMKYQNLKGYCYASDGTKMRFRLFGRVAYVLPPKNKAPEMKGVWLLKTGLMLMKTEVTNDHH